MKIIVTEMPSNCLECLFEKIEDHRYEVCSLTNMNLSGNYFTDRDSDCPLVDIKEVQK